MDEQIPSFSLLSDSSSACNDLELDFEEKLVEEFGEAAIASYIEEVQANGLLGDSNVQIDFDGDSDVQLENVDSDVQNNLENVSPAVQNTRFKRKGKNVPFLDLDKEIVKEINEGGINKSKKKVDWARRRFDEWRKYRGLDISIRVEDLDKKEFAGMLEQFICQVVKLDGSMFPTESLQDLFRKFGAMIRRAQEIRVAESGIEERPFDIRTCPIFTRARLACIAAMRRSRNTPGVCKKRKKVDEISFADEMALLRHIDHQIWHPSGLQKRWLFYCVSRWGIRGQGELYKVAISDFKTGISNGLEYVEYDERTSKNWDVGMDKYQEESFRMSLKCFEEDAVLTYKHLDAHLPALENYKCEILPPEKGGRMDGKQVRFCFMQTITKPRTNVWFNSKHRVNERKLSSWMKYMMSAIGVEGNFSGKSGRATLCSRMTRNGVPLNVGMSCSGHRTSEAYKRYDKSLEIQAKSAMDVVARPFNEDGTRRMFADVYAEELKKLDEVEVVKIRTISSSHVSDQVQKIDGEVEKLSGINSASGSSDLKPFSDPIPALVPNRDPVAANLVLPVAANPLLPSVNSPFASDPPVIPVVTSPCSIDQGQSSEYDDFPILDENEWYEEATPEVRKAMNLAPVPRAAPEVVPMVFHGTFSNCVIVAGGSSFQNFPGAGPKK